MAPRRQPHRPRANHAREADGGGHADPRLPGAGPPHRRPRPPAVERAAHGARARPGHLRAHHLGPRPRVPHRRPGRPGQDAAERDPPGAARRLLPHHRHRVHAHPGPRRAALDPGAGREPARPARPRGPALHPGAAQRHRGVRALPGHQVDRPEALRHRGLRDPDPHPGRHPRGGGRRPPGRGGHGHAAPRPAQRAHQHRGQELRPGVQGVRGHARPHRGPGLGRREVPPRPGGQVPEPGRQRDRRRAGRQPQPPGGGRPGGRGHGPGPTGRDQRPRGLLGAAHPHARRRRLRRPGGGGRDAQHERHQGLPGGRHHPHRGEQPDRLHHHARVRPVGLLLHGRGQDRPGAHLPRQRRRPRGVRAGGAAGLRLPPALPQGRRHRPRELPALRPQRGRRPQLHAAA